jgi:hypothetical protein
MGAAIWILLIMVIAFNVFTGATIMQMREEIMSVMKGSVARVKAQLASSSSRNTPSEVPSTQPPSEVTSTSSPTSSTPKPHDDEFSVPAPSARV